MNEITSSEFVYSLVDDNTASFLMEKEDTLVGIHNRYSIEVGKVLYEAKEKLANNYRGTFEKWYTALGFKTTNVYSYINAYEYTLELESSSKFEELEIFKQQPKSLQNEMSKPSADEKLNQKVFDGDITTHKQYKELEQKLKEKESQLEQAKHSEQIAIEQLEREQNKEPEKIEVVPDEYKTAKENELQLAQALKEAQQEVERIRSENKLIEKERNNLKEQLKDVDEKSVKYDELTKAIQEMEGQMTRGQKRIQAQKDVYELVSKSKELLIEITPIPYVIDAEYVKENEYARKALLDIADQTDKFLDNLRGVLDESRIIEGVVIDE